MVQDTLRTSKSANCYTHTSGLRHMSDHCLDHIVVESVSNLNGDFISEKRKYYHIGGHKKRQINRITTLKGTPGSYVSIERERVELVVNKGNCSFITDMWHCFVVSLTHSYTVVLFKDTKCCYFVLFSRYSFEKKRYGVKELLEWKRYVMVR